MAGPVFAEPITREIRGEDFPWAEMMPGIEIKVLRASTNPECYTLIARFAPGTTLPRHRHFGEVHAFTISGAWRYLDYDWIATAGSAVYEPPGSTHTLNVPEDGTEPAVVMFVVYGGMILFDDDDNFFMIDDAAGMVERYVGVLESKGEKVPEIAS